VAKQGSTELRRAASVAKQIYGREELDRYGDTNTLDVLRRLPGVNVDTGGPRMRGLGAGYTQILINGDPAPQGFNLDQLSPSQIERIEVLKATTADQSSQAIAGTINVILKETSRRSLSTLRVGLSNGRDRPVGNLNYAISESNGPVNVSLPVSLFEWDRQVRNLVDRQMAGTDGKTAVSEQLGTNTSWGWGYNFAPRINYKISDEQTLSLATFFQKGYWNYTTDFANRAVSGNPVFDDNAVQNGFWENRRGNLTWIHRFSEDQRIEIKAGVQQFRSGFDFNNLRANVTQLRTNGGNQDDAYTQAANTANCWALNTHSPRVGTLKRESAQNVAPPPTAQVLPCCLPLKASPLKRKCADKPSTFKTSGSFHLSGSFTWVCATSASCLKASMPRHRWSMSAVCCRHWPTSLTSSIPRAKTWCVPASRAATKPLA
jgi:iron complex outermembrane receptor protein